MASHFEKRLVSRSLALIPENEVVKRKEFAPKEKPKQLKRPKTSMARLRSERLPESVEVEEHPTEHELRYSKFKNVLTSYARELDVMDRTKWKKYEGGDCSYLEDTVKFQFKRDKTLLEETNLPDKFFVRRRSPLTSREVQVFPPKKPTSRADAIKLEQVLKNLLEDFCTQRFGNSSATAFRQLHRLPSKPGLKSGVKVGEPLVWGVDAACETISEEEKAYHRVWKEVIKQDIVACAQRGHLLDKIQNYYHGQFKQTLMPALSMIHDLNSRISVLEEKSNVAQQKQMVFLKRSILRWQGNTVRQVFSNWHMVVQREIQQRKTIGRYLHFLKKASPEQMVPKIFREWRGVVQTTKMITSETREKLRVAQQKIKDMEKEMEKMKEKLKKKKKKISKLKKKAKKAKKAAKKAQSMRMEGKLQQSMDLVSSLSGIMAALVEHQFSHLDTSLNELATTPSAMPLAEDLNVVASAALTRKSVMACRSGATSGTGVESSRIGDCVPQSQRGLLMEAFGESLELVENFSRTNGMLRRVQIHFPLISQVIGCEKESGGPTAGEGWGSLEEGFAGDTADGLEDEPSHCPRINVPPEGVPTTGEEPPPPEGMDPPAAEEEEDSSEEEEVQPRSAAPQERRVSVALMEQSLGFPNLKPLHCVADPPQLGLDLQEKIGELCGMDVPQMLLLWLNHMRRRHSKEKRFQPVENFTFDLSDGTALTELLVRIAPELENTVLCHKLCSAITPEARVALLVEAMAHLTPESQGIVDAESIRLSVAAGTDADLNAALLARLFVTHSSLGGVSGRGSNVSVVGRKRGAKLEKQPSIDEEEEEEGEEEEEEEEEEDETIFASSSKKPKKKKERNWRRQLMTGSAWRLYCDLQTIKSEWKDSVKWLGELRDGGGLLSGPDSQLHLSKLALFGKRLTAVSRAVCTERVRGAIGFAAFVRLQSAATQYLWRVLKRRWKGADAAVEPPDNFQNRKLMMYYRLPFNKLQAALGVTASSTPDEYRAAKMQVSLMERELQDRAETLQQIFAYYCAAAGEHSTLMSSTNYWEVVKACDLSGKTIAKPEMDLIYQKVLMATEEEVAASPITGKKPLVGKKEDLSEKGLGPSKFVEVLVRIGLLKYKKTPAAHQRVKTLLETDVLPHALRINPELFRRELRHPEVLELFRVNKEKLVRVFAYYLLVKNNVRSRRANRMSADGYVQMLRDCNAITPGMTVVDAKSVYAFSQIGNRTVPEGEDVDSTANLSFSCFLECLGLQAIHWNPCPFLPISQRVRTFVLTIVLGNAKMAKRSAVSKMLRRESVALVLEDLPQQATSQ